MVFDIGGVLLDWDPRYLYRKLISDLAEMEWFLANVCTPAWHAEHDRGLSTAESCAALAEQRPQYAGLIRAWSERGEEMVEPDREIYQLLLRRFGLDAATTLFIDDFPVNVV